MNQIIKDNRMKLVFVFTFIFLGLMLSNQPLESAAQTQTRNTRPTPTTNSPTLPKNTADKDKPVVKMQLPDLQVTEVKADLKECNFYFRIVNKGSGNAGPSNLYVNFIHSLQIDGKNLELKRVVKVNGLAPGKDTQVAANSTFFWPPGRRCASKELATIQAMADALYLYQDEGYISPNIFGLMNPRKGAVVPNGMKVAATQVEESNEDNNELVVTKSQFKPYP